MKQTLLLYQYAPEWENKEANKEKLLSFPAPPPLTSPGIAIFPEMTLTGFSMAPEKTAENSNGETVMFFQEFARANKVHCFAGYQQKKNNRFYNSLVHLSPSGELVAEYNKIHLFGYAGENEKYTAGRETVITQANGLFIGLGICYDLRFPELFRRYPGAGAELIIIIANWPVTRIAHWRSLLRARAIENQCFVAGVNRVGNDPFVQYNGCTSVFSPMGEELYVNEGMEEMAVIEIDMNAVSEVRNKFPFLNDMCITDLRG